MRPLTASGPGRPAALCLSLAWLCLVLTGCGREDDPVERMAPKIAAGDASQSVNTQTQAREMFDALCARRGFADADCACMRDRMLRAGTRAMAYVGASYGGDLAAAAEIGAEMEAEERAQATSAYLAAETACRAPAPGPAGGGADDAQDDAPATMADVRASCRPSMADICACRATALRNAFGDGAFEAAIAINSGDRTALERLGEGREEGWGDRIADAYARTSAPCIVQASSQRRQ